MKAITWILRCYPPRWRERYHEEILALLEQHTITLKTVFDLLLGALDARLDPTYRSKEGIRFSNIRDTRSLSIIYVCTLIVFLFSSSFWLILNGSLAFQDNALGAATETVGSILVFIVPLVGLIALLCFAWVELKNSFQNRRWVVLLFALLCLSLALALFSNSISFPPTPDFPLFVYIPDLLLVVELILLFSTGLLVIGVKGIHLLRNSQGRLVFLILAFVLLLPFSQLAYSLWGMHGGSPGEITQLAPGSFLVGNTVFSSVANFAWFVAQAIAPYLTLGGLLLALVDEPLSARRTRVAQRFGILMLLLLAFNLATILTWDVNRWLAGHVWIFDPTAGIWPLFRGQWVGALVANALVLALAFSIMLVALMRSFTTRPGGDASAEHQAA